MGRAVVGDDGAGRRRRCRVADPDAGRTPAGRVATTVVHIGHFAAGPTVAISLAKRLVNSALESERGAAFRAEALALEVGMHSADSIEGVQSFLEQRPAEYRGW